MHTVVLIVVCQKVSINHGFYEEKANPGPSLSDHKYIYN
jgi:hypothetical protein